MEDFKPKRDAFRKQKRAGGEKDFHNFIRKDCCTDEMDGSFGDCDSFGWPKGPAMNAMLSYASSEESFYKDYLEAWTKATNNGWELKPLA